MRNRMYSIWKLILGKYILLEVVFWNNYVTQYLVLKNYICTVKFVNCGKLRRAESWSNEEIDYSSTKWEPGNFHAGKILQGLWCTLGESWPRKIRLDHQKTFTWFTQWVVPKLVLVIFPTSNTVSSCAWCPSLPRTSWCAGVRSPLRLIHGRILIYYMYSLSKNFLKIFYGLC